MIIGLLTKKSNVSFEDAQLIHGLIGSVGKLFEKADRKCVHVTHKCNYRDGACKILDEKGADWTLDDILSCPFREKIEDGQQV
jgi:hypothetical protein